LKLTSWPSCRPSTIGSTTCAIDFWIASTLPVSLAACCSQTEFGRYGTSQLGQLRHIADTAETYLSGSLAAGEIEVGKSPGED
jgi:hypothetical protein